MLEDELDQDRVLKMEAAVGQAREKVVKASAWSFGHPVEEEVAIGSERSDTDQKDHCARSLTADDSSAVPGGIRCALRDR